MSQNNTFSFLLKKLPHLEKVFDIISTIPVGESTFTPPNGCILNVGCGYPGLTDYAHLHNLYSKRFQRDIELYTAIDVDPEVIAFLEGFKADLHDHSNIFLNLADASINLDELMRQAKVGREKFGLILCRTSSIDHDNYQEMWSKIYNNAMDMLAPGGAIITTHLTYKGDVRNKSQLMKSGFEIVYDDKNRFGPAIPGAIRSTGRLDVFMQTIYEPAILDAYVAIGIKPHLL